MRLMFSEKSSNWQLGFSTSKVIFAQMQSAGTCPFLFNSTSTWIEGQTSVLSCLWDHQNQIVCPGNIEPTSD